MVAMYLILCAMFVGAILISVFYIIRYIIVGALYIFPPTRKLAKTIMKPGKNSGIEGNSEFSPYDMDQLRHEWNE